MRRLPGLIVVLAIAATLLVAGVPAPVSAATARGTTYTLPAGNNNYRMAAGPDGDVYALNVTTSVVSRIRPDGTWSPAIATVKAAGTQAAAPSSALAVAPDGSLFVLTSSGVIEHLGADGTDRGAFANGEAFPGFALDVSPSGDVRLETTSSPDQAPNGYQLLLIHPDGTWSRLYTAPAGAALGAPQATPDGGIAMTVVGRSVGAVVLSSAGIVERSFTIPGAINIWAAAVDNDGSVYVDYTLQSSVDDDRLGRFGADSTTTLNIVDQGLAAPAALVWGPGHELMSVNDQLGDVTTVSSAGVVTKHAFTFQRSGSGGEQAIADRWGNVWIYSMPMLDSKGTRGNQITRYTSTSRIGGATRYDVSGAAASAAFGRDVPVVFVASGAVFPDALSGGAAAAALGGPVLLVPPSGALGSSTVRALTRLRPHAIVVLGGTASVSSAVQSALRSYAPSVTRIGGADRYEVSASLSASVFSPGVARVYVATGATFPDALSGAAAAGASHAPVLLVPASGAIPDAVSAELARLHPGVITVLGGTGSVGVDVAGDLAAIAPVTRIGGVDRYTVSAALSSATFRPGVAKVFVARGDLFPDALSGAPVAAVSGAPVLLLAPTGAIPTAVAAELKRLKPHGIIELGGASGVSATTDKTLLAYIR